jgi:undecaprenyl-phosphate 4-deoxy-4-formamido-L-arabinose transferase
MSPVPDISIVIPIFNEQATLPLLFGRLYPALDALRRSYEIVFVDDGSSDTSPAMLRTQFEQRPAETRVVYLARNAGQHAAVLAGFERSRGRYVVTLDADLQNAPEDVALVVKAMDEGYDYVGSIRQGRQDPWWRRTASRVLNGIRERTTRIKMTDQGCMLRGYDRLLVNAINNSRESSTFVPALGYALARRPTEIPVSHAERAAGESRYSLFSLLRLNFDLMTGYSLLPLQLCSFAGFGISVISMIFVVYLALRRLIVGAEAEGVFTLLGLMFFLIGIVLLALGMIGEYVGRIYQQVRDRPRFIVAAVLEQKPLDPQMDAMPPTVRAAPATARSP